MEPAPLRARVEEFVRSRELIPPGGEVACLVSGGADSTCLWHVLRTLGYRVSALHVNHGLRGDESEGDASFCEARFGAEVVESNSLLQSSEAALRDARYRLTAGRGLRATGHTASDQVETVLYRLVSSGRPGAIKPKREDGVVRPLLVVTREETQAYCRAEGLPFRVDSSNVDTRRGLIRDEILPLLRRLHPGADANLLAVAEEPGHPRLPRKVEEALAALLAERDGTKHADLGHGVRATREYDRLSLERGPVRWGPWRIDSEDPALEVRAWLPGDRLAGRRKKVQDVFTDAKIPRRERADYPLVVRDGEVVAVPGIVDDPAVRVERVERA
jgi:tRNA(Ile)-lysidine synthase